MDISFGGPIFGARGISPLGSLGSRRRSRASLIKRCQAAAEYTGSWGWTVTLGVRPDCSPSPAATRCPCGDPRCAAPGLHPLEPGLAAPDAPKGEELPPGSDLTDAQEAWAALPGAPLLLPVGRSFDLLDVPEPAGLRALVRLERMGTRLGPVLATPTGRALFFVAPGAAAALPELLYKTGWDDAGLDLTGHGTGGYVAVPPTVLPGLGPAHWLLPPSEATVRRLPEARLLLGTLAYACHRGHGDPRLLGAGTGCWAG